MQVSRGWTRGLSVCALLLAGTTAMGAQERTSGSDPDTVLASVDVLLTHRVVERDGAQAWPSSTQTAFTLQKLRTRSGATRIALAYRPSPDGRRTPASANPLEGARVEYDPERRATTVFDGTSRRPNPRLSMDRRPEAGLGSFDDWLKTLRFKVSELAARRQALERTHGRPVGTVGRLTRYVQRRDDVTEEVLADPSWGVPVEVNVIRQNELEGHTAIEYEAAPGGHLRRRRVRTEQVIDRRSGRRAITSVEFSNVSARGW